MRFIFYYIVIFAFNVITYDVYALTILIDPGHGGDDVGAKGWFAFEKNGNITTNKRHLFPIAKKAIYEKDLTLAISKMLFNKLRGKYSVYLTRSFDHAITLDDRAKLAEKIGADLFISVHINSDYKDSTCGFETYYLNNHNDLAVKKVENIENQKFLKEEDVAINKILIDLVIERTVDKSKKLAINVHEKIKKIVEPKYHIVDRRVQPGLFYVLALAKRPAILLEVGFMSNPEEMKKLVSDRYQNDYTDAVVEGIDSFVNGELKFVH